jgi:macrolide transport system ATP-binding/permease protein
VSTRLRLALACVALAAPIVPSSRRATWRAQWRADLFHYAQWLDRHRPTGTTRRALALASRTAGCLPHAIALRLQQWSPRMLSHDLKFAWRMLVGRPSFTLVAILILGLGIGANATIFSWVETVLLQPIPGVESSRLIALHGKTTSRDDLSFSYPDFIDIRSARLEGLDDVIAFRGVAMNLRGDGEPVRLWGEMVTPNFFDVLRITPVLGRGFTEAEGTTNGREAVAVLSYAAWHKHFTGDPAIVGRNITLNGRPFTVIGIAPEGFRGTMIGLSLDVFVPITMQRAFMSGDRLPQRGTAFLQVYGRLAPDATMQQAHVSLDVAAARLWSDHRENDRRGIATEPVWRDGAAGLLLPVMTTLMAVVGVVLLIACANLAGLMLARAAGRQREVAVRLAVGASRGRVVRQFLVESTLLAGLGGVAGILLARWTSGLLMALIPATPFPVRFDASVSPRVVFFSLAVTFVAAVAFGLLPALRASRPDVGAALKDAATAVSGGAARTRLRHSLVVAQVALSLLLLVCAALFVRGLAHASRVDPGFAMRDGVIAAVDLLPNGYDEASGSAFHRELLARVSALPGVASASIAYSMPLDISGGSDMGIDIDGYQPSPGEEVGAAYNRVGPRYFETMGIAMVAGRPIDDRDVDGRQLSVVVNETMAKKYWGGTNAVGRVIRFGSGPAVIVGIARDGKYRQLNEAPRNFLYVPIAQYFRHDALLIVKTVGDAAPVIPMLQAQVRGLDPNLPLFDVRTVGEHMKMSVFIPRMAGVILTVFGALALLLAVVGLYSVVAFGVAQRTREIGVRVALGASRGSVVRLVLRQGLKLTAIGLVIGLAFAAAAAQALRSQLMGVAPTDLASFAGTAILLLAVALIACALPALRAARLDPVRALRLD